MKKFVLLPLYLLLIFLSGQAWAKPVWTTGVGFSDDQGAAIVGIRPDPNARSEYRVEIDYYDGIRQDTQEGIGLMAGVTYDVIQDLEVPLKFPGLGEIKIKVDGYLGGDGGLVANLQGKENYDAIVRGILGLGIGDQHNRAAVEFLLPVTKILDWDNLGNLDDTKQIRLVFVHRWK